METSIFFQNQRIEDDDKLYPERSKGRDTYSTRDGLSLGTESRTYIEKRRHIHLVVNIIL